MSAPHAVVLVATVAGVVASASAAAAEKLAFVSCPIIRDTRTVPCWLTEYEGETYYLGIQTDVSAPFNPPSLKHRILVEGTVAADKPRICGGKVIEPVTVSILEGRVEECNVQLPSDERLQLPFEPPRPPGPSKGRLAFDYGPPPAPPQPPFTARSFTVTYEFDGMVGFKHPRMITPIVNYANLAKAKSIEIVGHRGATQLSNGTLMAEDENIAEKRARQIEQLLRGAGVTAPQYTVRWDAVAHEGGPEKRDVTVLVTP